MFKEILNLFFNSSTPKKGLTEQQKSDSGELTVFFIFLSIFLLVYYLSYYN